ncbi:hypothetical protein GGF32_003808 [Allomyces javanicus]|nr:hypothetical protein GGF32_003808 [Allomyces javanicus]
MDLLRMMDGLSPNPFVAYCTDKDYRGTINRELMDILELERTPTIYYKGQKHVGMHALELVKSLLGAARRSDPVAPVMRLPTVQTNVRSAPPTRVQSQVPADDLDALGDQGLASFDDSEALDFACEIAPQTTRNPESVLGSDDTSELLRRLEEERSRDVPIPVSRH